MNIKWKGWFTCEGSKDGDEEGTSHSYSYSSSSETEQEGDKKPVTHGYQHESTVDAEYQGQQGKEGKGKMKVKGKMTKFGTDIQENKSRKYLFVFRRHSNLSLHIIITCYNYYITKRTLMKCESDSDSAN